MGQRLTRLFGIFFFIHLIGSTGCDRGNSSASSETSTASSGSVMVASLVPAATDLLIGMGASEHLVAVSNYDSPREEIKNLPRVGDYHSIDWEKLAAAKANVMIVFMSPERMPAAVKENADRLGMQLVNVKIERLDDVYGEIEKLGKLVNEPAKAQVASVKLRRRFDEIASQTAGKPRVRTLILRDESAQAAVGGDTFIDDALTLAGGENVLKGSERYPTIDTEKLVAMNPDAIFQLLPDASPQLLDQAKAFWAKVPNLAAVKNNRVYVLTDWYVEQPGFHLADLTESFAKKLHPAKAKS